MAVELMQGDCMDYMRTLPDKAFDLAIVDPPYGIDAANMTMGKGKDKQWGKKARLGQGCPIFCIFH